MNIKFVIFNELNYFAKSFETHEEATKWAIENNRLDRNHPSYLLIDCTTDKVFGLRRRFGEEINEKDCWLPLGDK